MPTAKRPPPSPIVPPLDHAGGEGHHLGVADPIAAAAAAQEPPAKVARLEEHDVSVEAAAVGVEDVPAEEPPVAMEPVPAEAAVMPTPVKTEEMGHPHLEPQPLAEPLEETALPLPLEPPTPVGVAPADLPPPLSPVVNPMDNVVHVQEGQEGVAVADPMEIVEESAQDVSQEAGVADPMAMEHVEGQEGDVKAEEQPGLGVDEETAKVIDMAVDAVDIATAKAEDTQQFASVVDAVEVQVPHDDQAHHDVTIPGMEELVPKAEGTADTTGVMKTEAELQAAGEFAAGDAPKKLKKERKEFTAEEKLRILSELNGPNPPTVQALLEKYGVSKSSLHRWRQPDKLERLHEMVNGGEGGSMRERPEEFTGAGGTGKFRKRDMNDKLRRIKLGLQEFCVDNLARAEDDQLAITSSLIQLKANEIRDELLKQNEEMPGYLTSEEISALVAFKGSKSWACLLGNQLGYLSNLSAVVWSEKARTNTAIYLESNARQPPKEKKKRLEFTAQEKLAILEELESTNAQNRKDGQPLMTVEAICQKHGTSKSSLHRWKQQYRSGVLQAHANAGSGFSNAKRIFNDKLHVIKRALNDWYIANEALPAGERKAVTYTELQGLALRTRRELLERHHAAVLANQTDQVQDAAVLANQTDQAQDQAEEQQKQAQQQPAVEGQTSDHSQEQAEEQQKQAQQQPAVEGQTTDHSQEQAEEQQKQAQQQPAAEGQQQPAAEGQGTKQDGEGAPEQAAENETATATVDTDANKVGTDIIGSREEVSALENFKASNSWLREIARKFGWRLDMDTRKDHLHVRPSGHVVAPGPGYYQMVAPVAHTASAAQDQAQKDGGNSAVKQEADQGPVAGEDPSQEQEDDPLAPNMSVYDTQNQEDVVPKYGYDATADI